MMRRRLIPSKWILICVIMASVAIFWSNVYAHKVNLFAYSEGRHIYIQGYFLDGKKAKNSRVTVYSITGELLAQGMTNGEGEYAFLMPAKQDIRIVLNAGEGHQAEHNFKSKEILYAATTKSGPDGKNVTSPLNSEASNDMIRRAVADGLLPLAREIAELKERRAASDIIGGLGFIMGILGLFAYSKAKRKN